MLFSRQLPVAVLNQLCHMLRVNLGAGVRLRDVVKQIAERGSRHLRPVAQRIHQQLDKGNDLRAALNLERDVFPPLFIGMADVGEQTGHLPEVMHELEKYYQQRQQDMRAAAQPLRGADYSVCPGHRRGRHPDFRAGSHRREQGW